jgi:hypothetical protein
MDEVTADEAAAAGDEHRSHENPFWQNRKPFR